jgi:hypothetical protein
LNEFDRKKFFCYYVPSNSIIISRQEKKLNHEKKHDPPNPFKTHDSKEFEKYVKANEESGKTAAIPTPDNEIPLECVEGRDCFPDLGGDADKSSPTMGV